MKKQNIKIVLLMCLAGFIHLNSNAQTKPDYWSQFHGPNCTGLASLNARPPTEFGEDKNLLWKTDLPPGTSSPVIWNNQIYLTAYIQEDRELQILCIEGSSGKIIWTRSVFPEKLEKFHPISNPAQATITVDESGVYVYFASYGIQSYSLNGEMQWEMPMPVNDWADYGHASSPVVMDDKLMLSLDFGDEQKRSLLALHKKTGETAWKTPLINPTGYSGHSTPVRHNDLVVLHRCGGIWAFLLEDGSPVWWLPLMTLGESTPVIHNNTVYVGAWTNFSEKERRGNFFNYNSFEKALTDFDLNGDSLITGDEIPMDLLLFMRPELLDYTEFDEYNITDKRFPVRLAFGKIDLDRNGVADQAEWTGFYMYWTNLTQDLGLLALPLGLTGELSMDKILWMQLEKNPEVSSPVFCNESVFMTADGGWVTCMDATTGEVTFREKIGAPGPCIASPVAANGHIYTASHNGNVMVLTAEKNPVVVSRTRLTGKILATPAVNEDCLYIRTTEFLYAFQEK